MSRLAASSPKGNAMSEKLRPLNRTRCGAINPQAMVPETSLLPCIPSPRPCIQLLVDRQASADSNGGAEEKLFCDRRAPRRRWRASEREFISIRTLSTLTPCFAGLGLRACQDQRLQVRRVGLRLRLDRKLHLAGARERCRFRRDPDRYALRVQCTRIQSSRLGSRSDGR